MASEHKRSLRLELGELETENQDDPALPIFLDIRTLLLTRLLVQASSGGGKSFTLRRIAEQLSLAGVQVIIVDPEGEFSTLREKHNFVLAGPGGETQASVRSAQLLAHRLLELRASAVCDIYDLTPYERHTWVKTFLDGLINAPKKLWTQAVVIVDEAHMFMPEKGQGESVASASMIDLATRGRKRGLCAVFATQRLAKLAKNGTAELQNRMIGPTYEGVDLDRAADELSIPRRERDDWFRIMRRERDVGVFECVGRAFGKERLVVKVGPVETSTPKMGKHFTGPPPAPSAIQKLLPQLVDLPQEAEEKTATEATMRKRIVELERQVKALPPPPKEVTTVKERLIVSEKQLKVLGMITDKVIDASNRLLAHGREMLASLQAHAPGPVKAPPQWSPITHLVSPKAAAGEFKRVHRQPPDDLAAVKASRPTGVQQKVLDTLAWLSWASVAAPSRAQLAAALGRVQSGSFDTLLSSMKTAELIDYPESGKVALTASGKAAANEPTEAPSTEALQQRAMQALQPVEQRVLTQLLKVYPAAPSREALAESLGRVTSGSFDTLLSHIKTIGFITYPSKGLVRASDMLFVG